MSSNYPVFTPLIEDLRSRCRVAKNALVNLQVPPPQHDSQKSLHGDFCVFRRQTQDFWASEVFSINSFCCVRSHWLPTGCPKSALSSVFGFNISIAVRSVE